jgi:hypothetical protein
MCKEEIDRNLSALTLAKFGRTLEIAYEVEVKKGTLK